MDDIFELEESRPRRVWSIIAVVVPVVMFAGIAAWFIRVYVAPPMVKISESLVLAAPKPAVAPKRVAETTGAAVQVETPAPSPPAPIFGTLVFAPLNVPPHPPEPAIDVSKLDLPDPAIENSEPIAGPIPLPHARPRVSMASNGVPLPRPRP